MFLLERKIYFRRKCCSEKILRNSRSKKFYFFKTKKSGQMSGFFLVGKIEQNPNGFISFLCSKDTNTTQEKDKFRNLKLYTQLEKDLIACEDFANYAWAVARLKIG